MGFGRFIRDRREAAEIALNDFARRLDISPAYWSILLIRLRHPGFRQARHRAVPPPDPATTPVP